MHVPVPVPVPVPLPTLVVASAFGTVTLTSADIEISIFAAERIVASAKSIVTGGPGAGRAHWTLFDGLFHGRIDKSMEDTKDAKVVANYTRLAPSLSEPNMNKHLIKTSLFHRKI